MNEMIDKGASFCHVDKIKHEIQDIEVMTDVYHKWHGAIPSFSMRAINKVSLNRLVGIESINHIDILDISIILDPRAWARKYLIDASVSWLELLIIIMGINDKRLSSIPAHRNNQFDLDIAIKVLRIRVDEHRKMNGVFIIYSHYYN